VRDARFERSETILLGVADRTPCWSLGGLVRAAELADPREESIMLAVTRHRSPSFAGALTRGQREIPGVGAKNLTGR
jgi:hypothetical protein